MRKNLKRTLSLLLALILLTVSVNTFTSYSADANTQRNEFVIPGNIENLENTSELELRIIIGIPIIFHYISPEYEDYHGVLTFHKGFVEFGSLNISPPSDLFSNSTIKFGGTTYNISDYQKVTFSEGLTKSPDLFLLCCSNTEEIVFPSTLSRLKVFSLQFCTNLQDIYFYNPNCDIPMDSYTIPQSATIHCYKNSTAHKYAQTYNRNYKFIGETVPDGYDFKEDSYSFGNYSETIDLKYFQTMYGNAKGFNLWKEKRNAGGVCYGMALTTAALYNNKPSVDRIRSLKNAVDYLVGISSTININGHIISIRDYIGYAYIYQYSTNGNIACTDIGASELYNIVKNYTDNNRIAVTVRFVGGKGNHLVLAVGYRSNSILIDDPNNPNDYEEITINQDGSWSFSGYGDYNSSTAILQYQVNYAEPYALLATGTNTEVGSWYDSDTSYCISGMNYLDEDKLLLSVSSNNFTINSENAFEITDTGKDEHNDENNQLYWIDDKTVTVTGINENSEISLAGNDNIVGVTTSDSSDVELTVDEEKDIFTAKLDTTVGNDYTFDTKSFDENSDVIAMAVSGTASSDTVTATQTETGLVVTGISDGTVTLSKDDEVIETQEISNATSDIEITYDKTGENDDVSLDYEHSHTDSDTDGKCDICGETLDAVKNCTHLCHKTGFLGFIWKIVNIFNKLFKINPVCSCGMKHY